MTQPTKSDLENSDRLVDTAIRVVGDSIVKVSEGGDVIQAYRWLLQIKENVSNELHKFKVGEESPAANA